EAEQLVLAHAVELAILVDDAAEVRVALCHLSHLPGRVVRLHEDRDRPALGHEDGLLDVAEVLAVGVERRRPVADDLDAIEVVAVERVAASAGMAGQDREGEGDERTTAHTDGRDEIEAELELR